MIFYATSGIIQCLCYTLQYLVSSSLWISISESILKQYYKMKTKKRSTAIANEKKRKYMQERRRMPPCQYRKVNVRGDGNCLFRAISLGLYNTQEHHVDIRLGTVQYIAEHWDRYDEVIQGEYQRWNIFTKDQYVEYMSRHTPGEAAYAGHIEMSAAALAYDVKIAIHLDTLNDAIDNVGHGLFTIHVLYHEYREKGKADSGHYDFLQCIESTEINPVQSSSLSSNLSGQPKRNINMCYADKERLKNSIAKKKKKNYR